MSEEFPQECETCSALVVNLEHHRGWHERVSRAVFRAGSPAAAMFSLPEDL